MIYVGIDPGNTGAMAIGTRTDGVDRVQVFDYANDEALLELQSFAKDYLLLTAVLEKVHGMPGQGVSSVFKFGRNYGEWQGILKMARVPYELATPQKWQKYSFDSGKKEISVDRKEMSLRQARRLFPQLADRLKRKKDHDRADALLIWHYCARHAVQRGSRVP